jgi:adenine phosphoribosyltransferase
MRVGREQTPEGYLVNVEGIERRYPLVPLSNGVFGVYFFMPGDVELIELCGRSLADKIGVDFSYLVAPEAGGIPLAHAIARRRGIDYLAVRKSAKPYMEAPLVEDVRSITTPGAQRLVIDGRDVEKIRGKKVAVVDDVISTLSTVRGLIRLMKKCSAEVVCVATVFLEGKATGAEIEAELGCPLISLGRLPLFTKTDKGVVIC